MGIIDRKLLWLALSGTGAANLSGADALLDGEAQGLAFDFTDQSVRIIDTSTPSNSTRSTGIVNQGSLVGPSGKLDYTSPSNKLTLQSDGYIKYQAHNLCLQSEDFTTTWGDSGGGVTITANAALAPNGTTTADSLQNNVTTPGTIVSQNNITTVVGGTYAFKLRVKASVDGFLRYQIVDNASQLNGAQGWFNTSTGAWGTIASKGSGTLVDYGVEDLGNDWYLLTVVATVTTTNTIVIVQLVGSDTSTTPSTTPIFNVWGAHFHRYPANTDYIATTSAAKYALPYTYDTSGNCLGLLVEEARTNSILYSNDLSNANWIKPTISSTTQDGTLAPTGLATAWKPVATNVSNCNMAQSVTTTAAAWTASVYVKAGNVTTFDISLIDQGTAVHRVNINLTNGNTSAVSGSADSYGSEDVGNGWYRVWVTKTLPAVGTDTIGLYFNGTPQAGDYVYLWNPQLEAGSFPTSPVVTYSAAASRLVDDITIARTSTPLPGMATASSGEVVSGAMYFKTPAQTSVTTYVLDLAYDSNDRVRFRWGAGGAGTMAIEGATTDAGGAGIVGSGAMDADTDGSVAFRWAEDATAYSYSKVGTAQDEDTLCDVLGNAWSNIVIGLNFGSTIQKIVLVPSNWNNATLETKVGK